MLRPLLLGWVQELQGLHAPLLHVLPLPLDVHVVYLHCLGLCHFTSSRPNELLPQIALEAFV